MEPLRANAGDHLLLSDSTEMPGVPLDQKALSPPGHPERVSPKLGTGLSFLALATSLCACAGVGRDGDRGTCNSAGGPILLLAEVPSHPGLVKGGGDGGQHSTYINISI